MSLLSCVIRSFALNSSLNITRESYNCGEVLIGNDGTEVQRTEGIKGSSLRERVERRKGS